MFRLFLRTLVWLVIVGWGKYACGQNAGMSFPDFPLSQGVSAPFAGFVGDSLIVAGGCNFPDIPAAEGGKKKFYGVNISAKIPFSHPLGSGNCFFSKIYIFINFFHSFKIGNFFFKIVSD